VSIILLQFINAAIRLSNGTPSVIDELRELGLVSLFAAIYKRGFHLDWAEPSGRLFFINMYYTALAMWNATDASAALCQQVVEEGLVGELLNYLSDSKVDPHTLNENGIKLFVRPLLSMLHNVVQVCRCFVTGCMYT